MLSHRKFIKDMGTIGLVSFLIPLKGIVLLPVITKLLGAENYGIWIQLSITLSLITPIAVLGLPNTLVRFLAAEKDKKEIREGVWSVALIVFAVSSAIGMLFFIFAESISHFLQSPTVFVQILAFAIILECLNLVFINLFRAFQEIRKYAFFTALLVFGEIGLVTIALFLNYGLWGAVISLLIIRLVVFSLLSILIIKNIGVTLPTFSRLKEYLRFGLPTVASNVSYWGVQSSDRYLIGFFLGVLFVGYYSPAYAIGNLINLFIVPFLLVLPAVLSRFFDENRIDEVKTYLKYSLKYFLMIAIPAGFGLSVLSRELLTIFSTQEIAENAYFITPFVVLSILIYGIYTIFVQILFLFKKTRIAGTIWVLAAFCNIVLNLILIPRFGILGAALTTLVAYILAIILTWYYTSREFTFPIDWQAIIKSISASLLMAGFIIWFNPFGILQTMIAIVAGAILYLVLLFLFRGIKQKELEIFLTFLRV